MIQTKPESSSKLVTLVTVSAIELSVRMIFIGLPSGDNWMEWIESFWLERAEARWNQGREELSE